MGAEFLTTLGLAFIGGIILNVMPCVLPVLTMKVFHLVQHSHESPTHHRLHGVAYSGGIVVTLALLALGVIALRASGEMVGWGMQFQNPTFVAALTTLMFVFGLNALGVFEFTFSISGDGDADGYMGSFVNGIVAAIMSTPCSAPFLGTAAAVALGTGAAWYETLSLFISIGLGLAFPFLVVSFIPAVARALPRPGAWMITFKQLMGFTLMAAAIWLYGVLQSQVSPSGAQWFLGFLLTLAVALWGVEHFGGLMAPTRRRVVVRVGALALSVLAGATMLDMTPASRAPQAAVAFDAPVVKDGHINWAPFSKKRLTLEARRLRPVFADFTADWCANCKTNEKLFIETDSVRAVFKETGILPMQADWTNEDEEITAALQELGRSAIPVYAIYMPDGKVDLLPVTITSEMVIERLKAASLKYPPAGYQPIKEDAESAQAPRPSEDGGTAAR